MISKLFPGRVIPVTFLVLLLAACQLDSISLPGTGNSSNGGGSSSGSGRDSHDDNDYSDNDFLHGNDSLLTDSSCAPTGSGTDYPVGPGQSYASISEVPWGELGPGDTVRIHYRPEPYREKIVISTSGSEDDPIRICGVAGPNGERPVLDGDGAANDPDDS
ncbi:MAG TPA: hypothetical protein ENJ43_00865, partial [Gammaproteobacteria bacterium]|nr:hypothetical protein [Gammaproteobacteria bacterium]